MGAIAKNIRTFSTATVKTGVDLGQEDGRERTSGKDGEASGGEASSSRKSTRKDAWDPQDDQWLQQKQERKRMAHEQKERTKVELYEALWKTVDQRMALRKETGVDLEQAWTALFAKGSAKFLTTWSDLRTRMVKENRGARKDELKTARGLAIRVIRDWKARQKVWPHDAPGPSGKPAGFPAKTNPASGPNKPRAGQMNPALGSLSQAGKMNPPPVPGDKRGRKKGREREHRPRSDYSGGSSSGTEPPAKTVGVQRSTRDLSKEDLGGKYKPKAFRIPKQGLGKKNEERDPSPDDQDPNAEDKSDAEQELLGNDEPKRNPYVIHVSCDI